MNHRRFNSIHHRHVALRSERRGFALIAVLVLLGVIVTLCGVWARQTLHEQRRHRLRQAQLQAIRLAEAGLQRGLARRAADDSYAGETWNIPATEIANVAPATVEIKIVSDANTPTSITSTAVFAPSSSTKIQHTESLDFAAESLEENP